MEVRFTDRELDIMQVLWDRGSSTVAEVRDGLEDALAYNTVLTMLGVLEEKGYVTRDTRDRAHRYAPTVERDQAGAGALRRVAATLFRGSAEALLVKLLDQEEVGPDDLRRMREILDARLRALDADPGEEA
ncbi:MAG: BlaI/MecI/CopY family transcriptional regulator [Gemmatimonadota bacterium]